jgi:hypothetical protein
MRRSSSRRLRQLLRDNQVSWQRTRTWQESKNPDFDVKLDRIELVTSEFPQRCFAFDQFGRCRSARTTAGRGRRGRVRTGYRRSTRARTGSAASTAVAASPTTSCGV